MQATMQATTDTTGLVAQGFTAEQIQRLEELRAVYPMIEMVENIEQLRRIVFLKWLHEHRDDPADSIDTAA
ncbi:MAG TPA: hypothetical protein VFV93_08745 [Thermomicrobiales bacterium]|nr:hypothetical protein [Thermomicrobiales bacterium]